MLFAESGSALVLLECALKLLRGENIVLNDQFFRKSSEVVDPSEAALLG